MKKSVILIIVLVFIVCAYFGFKAAAKILPANNGTTIADQGSDNSTNVLQNNYLLVHVSDLTIEDPELISAWVAFVYQSNPPQLMFIQVYPSSNVTVNDKLAQAFSLSSTKELSAKFIKQYNTSFHTQNNGYILIDNIGAGYYNQWLFGQATAIASTPAMTDEEKQALRLSEQASFQQFCQLVSTGASNSYFSSVNWTLLLPDHYVTNLPFETIALTTDQIAFASSPVQCEVLSAE